MSIGTKLKWLRLRAGKTLRQQSDVFNVSVNSIHRWEHELSTPRMQTLLVMAEHYGVSPEWLISDEVEQVASQKERQLSGLSEEEELLELFRQLSKDGRKRLLDYAAFMCATDRENAIDELP